MQGANLKRWDTSPPFYAGPYLSNKMPISRLRKFLESVDIYITWYDDIAGDYMVLPYMDFN